MRILLTGAFGNVGRSAIAALRAEGDSITVLEAPTEANRQLAALIARDCRVLYGDIRDEARVREAIEGQEAVIHLAALIPPAADAKPELTREINIGGTAKLIAAAKAQAKPPRIVFASSIAAYGDRLASPWISTTDPLSPNEDDVYGQTKAEAERLLHESGLPFSILRLSYIIWAKKLKKDPLMFHMPPGTPIEACHTEDTGRAFAAAARLPAAENRTFDIGGGEACRTTFREYLDRMFSLFGLGKSSFLPDTVFARGGFHCGWYADSDEAERVLHFRKKSLEDYYREVRQEVRFLRIGAALVRPFIRLQLLAASPFTPRRQAEKLAASRA
jgi:nucleoside-diphosphate-sugar epimerase